MTSGTSPVVETNMMGYADLAQSDTGLLMRQFSRSFIISSSPSTSELSSNSTVLLINSDIGMGDNGIRRLLLEAIEKDSTLRSIYTSQNIAWSGTHSHSGVGGYLENLLPQLTSLGYVKQTAEAIVSGTLASIRQAHSSLSPTELGFGSTTLLEANINRSPSAYAQNPASERAQYQYDVDKELQLLKLGRKGFLNWFPVHGTSIYQNNTLVSTDNKGYAAFLSESKHDTAFPGKNSFVAGYVSIP
jgi:neutral ceramidase